MTALGGSKSINSSKRKYLKLCEDTAKAWVTTFSHGCAHIKMLDFAHIPQQMQDPR